MGGAPSPPPAPDPNAIIQAQEQANRVNQYSPFGSQEYGPNGLTTTLNPQMQGAADMAMKAANTPLTPLNNTQGFGNLQQQIMARMQNRMGSQPSQKMVPQNGYHPGGQMPAPFQAALGQIWGVNNPGAQPPVATIKPEGT